MGLPLALPTRILPAMIFRACPQGPRLVGVAMLHTRTIRDLDEMCTLAFPPPYALVDALEAAEGRSEAWSVLMAFEQGSKGLHVRLPERTLDEERVPAREQPVHGVGNHRGNQGVRERLVLECQSGVQDLAGEDRHAERRAKDGGEASGHASQDQVAALRQGNAQDVAQDGSGSRTDLRRGPLATRRAAGPDGDRGGDGFDQGHDRSHPRAPVVVGGNRRIGAVALRLRRRRVDQPPAQ